jgi:hypothetical protein
LADGEGLVGVRRALAELIDRAGGSRVEAEPAAPGTPS